MTEREKLLAGLLKEAVDGTRARMAYGNVRSDRFCNDCASNHRDDHCFVDCWCHRARKALAEIESERAPAGEDAGAAEPDTAGPEPHRGRGRPRKYPLGPDAEGA